MLFWQVYNDDEKLITKLIYGFQFSIDVFYEWYLHIIGINPAVNGGVFVITVKIVKSRTSRSRRMQNL
ncbi:MAG: hypothetical protein QNJ37_23410 [Crocosphaera sp.]|nr:hypothetical protein [Crocosphaera sp.]